jgi:hypothetical protein
MTTDEVTAKQGNWFFKYRDHWFGFIAIVVVHSIIQTLADGPGSFSLPLAFLGTLLAIIVATNCVALLLLIITWPFKKNFHMSRYMNILVIFAFIMMTMEIIHLALDFARGGK